jgi:hypothetical protein
VAKYDNVRMIVGEAVRAVAQSMYAAAEDAENRERYKRATRLRIWADEVHKIVDEVDSKLGALELRGTLDKVAEAPKSPAAAVSKIDIKNPQRHKHVSESELSLILAGYVSKEEVDEVIQDYFHRHAETPVGFMPLSSMQEALDSAENQLTDEVVEDTVPDTGQLYHIQCEKMVYTSYEFRARLYWRGVSKTLPQWSDDVTQAKLVAHHRRLDELKTAQATSPEAYGAPFLNEQIRKQAAPLDRSKR